MKKKKLNGKLNLSKKTISKFNSKTLTGGTGSLHCPDSAFELICITDPNNTNPTILSCGGCSIISCGGDQTCFQTSDACGNSDICYDL